MSTEQATDSMIPSEIEPAEIAPAEIGSEVNQQAIEPLHTVTNDQWKIIVHNDEVTPYDYVIHILGDLFMLSEELADHVAWTAHTKGVAVVVVRPRLEAEKLVKVAHGRARQVSYPLTFSLEQD
jgi:ATP-dependent Clp protease adaptor protein ClpS